MFKSAKRRILEDQNEHLKEKLDKTMAILKEKEKKLSMYEENDYTKISQLLRAELNMANVPVLDFSHQIPGEKNPYHYFYGKTQDQIRNILATIHGVYALTEFREICQYLINETGNHLALASRSREEDILSRGEMLGTARVLQEIGALAAEHESMISQRAEYDDKEIL